MIRARNLIRTFHSGTSIIHALDGVSLDIKSGEFVSIIGKSGSGKSTLLYQLGLLDKPDGGEIFIDDKNVENISDRLRTQMRLNDLGYIFQDYAILPSMSALDNVILPLLMRGEKNMAAKELAMSALKKVGLAERGENLPSQLSGGEQQRVAIARAIAHSPKIIFADEPTANLDTETSRNILEIFLSLNKTGQTIVMVTHEEEYAALTARSLIMGDGKIINERVY